MQEFANKKILLGISGGIAAYKAAFLVRELSLRGAKVRVVMTEAAKAFITPMTLQALSGEDVRCDLFDTNAERAMGHIELARWADVLVIAPATAQCLAKMANGIADDLLSTLYLVAEIPVIVCPAMNKSMWMHPASRANCATLLERGVIFVGPNEGVQACGEFGFGRMSEVDEIIEALKFKSVGKSLFGQEILITAGPTREPIDPVRYISNKSSGKMGYALAEAAFCAGAKVTLITGPTAIPEPLGVECVKVNTAIEMYDAVMAHLKPGMIFIGAAAVADYRLAEIKLKKLKKHDHESLSLNLIKNPDILHAVAKTKKASYVVGFAAETDNLLSNAREKLKVKDVNMIIANQVGDGIGFETENNQVVLITNNLEESLPLNNKSILARQIIAILATSLQNTAI